MPIQEEEQGLFGVGVCDSRGIPSCNTARQQFVILYVGLRSVLRETQTAVCDAPSNATTSTTKITGCW